MTKKTKAKFYLISIFIRQFRGKLIQEWELLTHNIFWHSIEYEVEKTITELKVCCFNLVIKRKCRMTKLRNGITLTVKV